MEIQCQHWDSIGILNRVEYGIQYQQTWENMVDLVDSIGIQPYWDSVPTTIFNLNKSAKVRFSLTSSGEFLFRVQRCWAEAILHSGQL